MKIIMGENLKQPFEDLKIEASMEYKNKEYEIWTIQDKDLETIKNMSEEEWESKYWNNYKSWWVGNDEEDPLNMGNANANIKINNTEIKAWIDYSSLLFEYQEDEEKVTFNEYIEKSFCSLTEYLEVEMGLSKPENIFASALSLAKQNNMTVGELFDIYEGNNQVIKENWVSEVDPSDDEYWHPDFEGDSKEEVIKATEDYINENDIGFCTYRIGKKINSTFPLLDYDSVENTLSDKAYDEVGDISEDFLSGVTKKQRKELEDGLNEVIKKWVNKHNLDPQYFLITDIEEFEVGK